MSRSQSWSTFARGLQPSETWLRSLTGMGHQLGHFFARRRGELAPHKLTARERQILQLAAQGMSGKTIAQQLSLSPSTVKSHFEKSTPSGMSPTERPQWQRPCEKA